MSCDEEERFINDIRFGLKVLEYKGVEPKNIKVFIDGQINTLKASFGNELDINEIKQVSSMEEELKNSNYENVILFTTGHGDEFGLTTENKSNSISPYKLISIVRSIQNLKRGLLIISQCFAGIFNYIEAKPNKNSDLAELCIIGSTGFEKSLSLSTDAFISQTEREILSKLSLENWVANIFLFYFFVWLYSPEDIDGNNKLTAMDSYKFASLKTNQTLNKLKIEYSYSMAEWVEKYKHFKQSLEEIYPNIVQFPDSLNQNFRDYLEMQNFLCKKNIDEQISILYTHQEPFILHSTFAQKLQFE